jgi:hypothetical protein
LPCPRGSGTPIVFGAFEPPIRSPGSQLLRRASKRPIARTFIDRATRKHENGA